MSQSVRRAARIIDVIAEEPQTVLQLAEAFGLHRSTMFRELQALTEIGYVRRRRDGRYSLGMHFISLSNQARQNLDLSHVAYDHIRRLHKSVGNTIHLAALMEYNIVYVDKVEDSKGIRMYSRIGNTVMPYCSGVGKAILADLDQAGRDAVLEPATWERFTDTTISSRRDLDRELETIRRQDFAVDDGEFENLVNCVAVPIRSSVGVVGALSLTALRVVQDLDQLKARIPQMRHTVELISRELGLTTTGCRAGRAHSCSHGKGRK